MTRVGFIGLGTMGRPMASNLLAAGHEVVVHNRSRQAVDDLVELGAERGEGSADVARRSEVVITCVPDTPDVEAVMFGADGVLSGMAEGGLIIDMSTIRPDLSRRLAKIAADSNVETLDAPVSGGEEGAKQGTLSIMVGGSEAAFERAGPLLEVLGRTVVHVGPAGAGQTVKAANQLVVAGTIALVSEALVLLEAGGADLPAAVTALSGGMAGNRIWDLRAERMLSGNFSPAFRAELHLKDLRISMATAQEHDVPAPVTGLVTQLYTALCARGMGGLDHTALLLLMRELSGQDIEQTHE